MKVILFARTVPGRTAEDQLATLTKVAERKGWQIAATIQDGRRTAAALPGLVALNDAIKRKRFDIVAAWSLDQLGATLPQIARTLDSIRAKGRMLYLHESSAGADTILAAGQDFAAAAVMLRRESQGTAGPHTGRPRTPEAVEDAVMLELNAGTSIRKIATKLRISNVTVQRIKRDRAGEL